MRGLKTSWSCLEFIYYLIPFLCLTRTTPLGDLTAVCLINASDKDVVLAAECAVGRAVETKLHVSLPFLSRTVSTMAEAAQFQEWPVHLQDLLERSSEDLSEEQRSQLAEL